MENETKPTHSQNKMAKITRYKFWSPIWIIPIVAGKTVIKSRSVDVGVIESVTLSEDFSQVVIKGRLNQNMDSLLNKNSIFWIVKPQIDKDGVSGLGTLLSGVYIELSPGSGTDEYNNKPFQLLESAPLASPNTPGIRINLVSTQSGVISKGAPVLFRGFKVGNVETSDFDPLNRSMTYRLFIKHPYESLVTENVRFWREGGVNFDLSPRGASLEVPSIEVLLAGGISFDLPDGAAAGNQATELAKYTLFDDKRSIQESQYTQYKEYLLFFKDSIAGLSKGAPVEYRGIRLGTVWEVPYYVPEMTSIAAFKFNIPVLIRMEPERLSEVKVDGFALLDTFIAEQKNGLRAAIKSANLFTGSMYIDLDFYTEGIEQTNATPEKAYGLDVIQTVPAGLSQIQAKVIQTLDNLNRLPLDQTVAEMNKVLAEGQKLLDSLNGMASSKEAQNIPKDLQNTIKRLEETLKGLQPGSDFHNSLQTDMEKFGQTLEKLQPLLDTLNEKSNALIFAAPTKQDPQPKAREN